MDAFSFCTPRASARTMANCGLFRKGAAILSVHTRAPIVPIAIEGFYDVWPRHKKFPKFGPLEMTIGKPMIPPPLSEASEATYEQFTAELKARVAGMWEELRQNNPPETASLAGTLRIRASSAFAERLGECFNYAGVELAARTCDDLPLRLSAARAACRKSC